MHATEEDLQAIAQIEESEAGGQEDDDDDDLPEPQAPLLFHLADLQLFK